MKLNLFHGTSEEYKQNILSEGFKIPKNFELNQDWLGIGIYFFKDIRYAKWWASTVRKFEKPVLIGAEIICDDEDYLDLTNEDDYTKFVLFYLEINREIHTDFINQHQRVAFYLDLYKKHHGIKLVSRVFYRLGKFLPYFNIDSKIDGKNTNKIICLLGYDFPQTQYCVCDEKIIAAVKEEEYDSK